MQSETFEKQSYNRRPEIIALIVIGIVVLVLAFLFLGQVRRANRRTKSLNNLRQLALSCWNYENAHSRFPSASAPIGTNGDHFGWEIQIVPFIETFCNGWQGLLDQPWDHPDSRKVFQIENDFFHSPHCSEKFDENGYSLSHYAATLETIPMGEPRSFESLKSEMEMFGEIAAGFQPWGKPGNARTIGNGIWFDEDSFGNPEYNGVSFAYVDGSVRYELLEHDRR